MQITAPKTLEVKTTRFHYDARTRTFTTFASDLDINFIPTNIRLESGETGRRILFVGVKNILSKTTENEIIGWQYRAAVENFTILVWND